MTADPRIRQVGAIETEPLFDMAVDLDTPFDFGGTRQGRRILFQATGGTFSGERLRGTVLPGGGDWALFDAKGDLSLDVRLTLRTSDDALVNMTYRGLWITPPERRDEMVDAERRHHMDPSAYYFRTTPRFETGSRDYVWLNEVVSVASGYAIEGGVAYRVYRVL